VLYVGELIGLLLIWRGYSLIVGDRTPSVHQSQRGAATSDASTAKGT
jgi:hypothetical protein